MKDNEKRFVMVYEQRKLGSGLQIIADRSVRYLFRRAAEGGGLTPPLGSDGKPAVQNGFDDE